MALIFFHSEFLGRFAWPCARYRRPQPLVLGGGEAEGGQGEQSQQRWRRKTLHSKEPRKHESTVQKSTDQVGA